jgi:hypothetical protein
MKMRTRARFWSISDPKSIETRGLQDSAESTSTRAAHDESLWTTDNGKDLGLPQTGRHEVKEAFCRDN